jgi:Mlc titration factor MtfA (ptsG expression regulator)
MSFSLRRWRKSRILRNYRLDEAAWRQTLARYRFLSGLTEVECTRLRELVTVFLHDKQVQGAGGLVLDDTMRMAIAVQACILLLNLPDNWYDDWVEVIVYPDEFVPQVEWEDEYGVVHAGPEIRAGEAWLRGPVILSWAEIGEDFADGVNVAIHEFAHKLDMLNGDADGYPPLHADMDRVRWKEAFSAAYEHLCREVDAGRPTAIDPYATEAPGEFFAVVSEAFIERPEIVRDAYPAVYAQLAAFYRQDPHARQAAAGLLPARGSE